jgi:hypothetical protein
MLPILDATPTQIEATRKGLGLDRPIYEQLIGFYARILRGDLGCGSGFWGGQRPSLAHYVTGMGPMDGATAAGGRSCCLSSRVQGIATAIYLRTKPSLIHAAQPIKRSSHAWFSDILARSDP